MADWPQTYSPQRRLFVPNSLPGGGFSMSLAPDGSGGKGDWAEIVSALPFPVALMVIYWDTWTGGGSSGAFDIGIGPSGQERVLVPDILLYQGTQNNTEEIHIPIAMPAGARVSMRVAGGQVGYGVSGGYTFMEATDRHRPRNTKAMSFGVSNGFGTPIAVASNGSAWGGYNALAGSPPYPLREVMICVSNNGSVPANGVTHAIDVGYGAGSPALAVIRGLYLKGMQSCWDRYLFGPYRINLPAGGTFYAGSTSPDASPGTPTLSVVGYW